MVPICLLVRVLIPNPCLKETHKKRGLTEHKIGEHSPVVARPNRTIFRHHARLDVVRLRSLQRFDANQLGVVHAHMDSFSLLVDDVVNSLHRVVRRERQRLPSHPLVR